MTDTAAPPTEPQQAFELACHQVGFDLIQPLQVGWYNQAVGEANRIDDLGSTHHQAILVGNTRALWTKFLQAFQNDPTLQATADPLNAYTERSLANACQVLSGEFRIYFSHSHSEPVVAMQQLAHLSGLAHLSPSHLNVHPDYGPWIALRAVVVTKQPGPTEPRTAPIPCQNCDHDCVQAFEKAVALDPPATGHHGSTAHWRAWLAVRDACPTGRTWRYSDQQIEYHYTHNRRVLLTDT